jgi:hypothetical protein
MATTRANMAYLAHQQNVNVAPQPALVAPHMEMVMAKPTVAQHNQQ